MVSLRFKQREDTVISALWASGMAIGVLFISATPGYQQDLMGYLFGDILMVSPANLAPIAILDAVVVVISLLLYKQFVAICFDEEFARTRGVRVEFHYFTLLGPDGADGGPPGFCGGYRDGYRTADDTGSHCRSVRQADVAGDGAVSTAVDVSDYSRACDKLRTRSTVRPDDHSALGRALSDRTCDQNAPDLSAAPQRNAYFSGRGEGTFNSNILMMLTTVFLCLAGVWAIPIGQIILKAA